MMRASGMVSVIAAIVLASNGALAQHAARHGHGGRSHASGTRANTRGSARPAGTATPAAPAGPAATPAEQDFTRGRVLYRARRYAEALEAFRASLATLESPNARLFEARCLRGLDRPVEAVTAYDRAIDAAGTQPRYAATRTAAANERRGLERRVGRLSVVISNPSPSATVELAGRRLALADLAHPIAVAPGVVELDVRADRFEPEHRRVDIAAGETLAVTLTLREHIEPAPSPPEPRVQTPVEPVEPPHVAVVAPVPRVPLLEPVPSTPMEVSHGPAIAVLALGAAGLAVSGVFAYLTNARFQNASLNCPEPTPPCVREVEQGQQFEYATYGALGAGVAIIAVGAVLYVGAGSGSHAVRVGLRGQTLVIGGSF